MLRSTMAGRLGPWRSRLSGAAGSVSALSLAAAASQVLQVAASIFLARLYSPVDFGVFAICSAVAFLVSVAVTAQYPVAIPLVDSDDEARVLTWLSVTLTLALVAVLTVVWWVLRTFLTSDDDPLGLGPSVWLIPVLAAVLGVWTALRAMQSRRGEFGLVSVAAVTGTALQVVGQFVAAALGWLMAGLTAGYTVGRAANAGCLLRGSVFGPWPGTSALVHAARRWSRMPTWMLLPALLNAASITAVASLIGLLYGVEIAGYFGLAMSLLAMPAALLGQSVSTVLLPQTARLERENQPVAPVLERAATGLTTMGVPFFGAVLLLGPQIFTLVFGPEWETAGVIAALLAPWLLVSLVSSALSGFAVVKSQQRVLFAVAIVEALLRFGSLLVGSALDSYFWGLALYGVSGLVISILATAWFMHLAGGSVVAWLHGHWIYLTAAVMCYGGVFLLGPSLPTGVWIALCGLVTVLFGVLAMRQALALTSDSRSA